MSYDYPIASDSRIGTVLFGQTNQKHGEGGVARFFRELFSGTTCNYVGDSGIMQYKKGLFGAPEQTVLIFSECDRISVSHTRMMYGGSYKHTAHSYTWYAPGTDDRILLEGKFESYEPETPSTDNPSFFYDAAERAWYAHKIPLLQREFREKGRCVFGSTRGYEIHVGTEEIAWGYPNGSREMRRAARSDVHEFRLEKGKLWIYAGAAGTHEIGSGYTGNFDGLVRLLPEAGYPPVH